MSSKWRPSSKLIRAVAKNQKKYGRVTHNLYMDEDIVEPINNERSLSHINSNSSTTSKLSRIDEFDPMETFVNESLPNECSDVSSKPVRKCADCKKAPHMQCLHCSKYVCMECGQKHVALANEQVDVAQHVLNEKMSIIDRLSAVAKERVNADRNRIIEQADTERDQAFIQIDQIVEQQKKQIRDKNAQFSELSLDEIPSFIQHMINEMECINEANHQFFRINSTLPKIQVEHGISTRQEKL